MAVLYDANGNPIYPNAPVGAYMANISIRHTAADAALSAVFAMKNPSTSTRTISIRNIRLLMAFDGTAVAGASVAYEFIGIDTMTGDPTTGTTVPRIKKRNSYPTSQIQDANIQQKSGVLTMTGVTYESGPFHVRRIPASITGTSGVIDLDFAVAGMPYETFDLVPGEGLAIRLHAAAIIGQSLSGSIEWEER